MKKIVRCCALILFAVLCVSVSSIAEETITLTTYYPAPYGAYEELTTSGDTYLATDSGSVGIGTTSPGGKLEVADGAADPFKYGALQITRLANQGDNKFHLSFIRSGTAVAGMGFLRNLTVFGIQFTGDNSPTTLGIFMRTSGYVGIGTTNPSSVLDVVGTANATSYSVGGTSGASGTFISADGKTVTVTNGIITSII